MEHIAEKRGFARTTGSGDHDKAAEREANADIF
jgi:hypothetical protein